MSIRNLAVAACSVFLLGACDSTPSDLDNQVTGTFALESVNGQNLPVTLSEVDASNRTDAVAGAMTLESNGTFSGSMDLDVMENGQTTRLNESTTGEFTTSGSTITFTSDAGAEHSATLHTGNTAFTQQVNGNQLLYRRQ